MPEADGTIALKCPASGYEFFEGGTQIAWEDLSEFFAFLNQPEFEQLAEGCAELSFLEGEGFIAGATYVAGKYLVLQVEGSDWRDIADLLVNHQVSADVYGIIEDEYGQKSFYLRQGEVIELTQSFEEDNSLTTPEEVKWRNQLPEDLRAEFQ